MNPLRVAIVLATIIAIGIAQAATDGCSRAAVPRAAESEDSRELHHGRPAYDGCLPKLTLGTCFASAGAWKKGYSLKLNIFAVRFAGNWRRDVL